MTNYERTVNAALSETRGKFALAEALAEDIPPRRSGPSEDSTIPEYLAEAREEIINAGGEARSVRTLWDYRNAALWVQRGNASNFGWISGVSFTAHSEAYKSGMSYEEFAAKPLTTDEIRKRAGKAGTDGPPAKIVQSWTPEQKAEAARELLSDPEVAEQISEAVTDHVAADPKRTAAVVSKRRAAMPTPEVDEEQPRPKRDYDAMTESWVNQASVTMAAESSGKWKPSEQSEALLYFISQILGTRREPTGEQADFVNEKLESLFGEVEAYANSEVA